MASGKNDKKNMITDSFYSCCPICKYPLVQAKNGMDGVIKCPKCANYIHIIIKDDTRTLRHTHASMLSEIGVEQKYIQTRLGHSDVKITIDVYEHTTDLMRMRGRKAINDLYM